MKRSLIILVIIAISCTSNATKNNISTQDQLFEILAKANSFGFGYKLGQTFRATDNAYQSLMTSKTPKEIFIRLFENGNINSKIYALCALHKLDNKTYLSLSKKLNKKEKINTQFGCSIGEESVEAILLEIENNNPGCQP